jgi:hypothetical protein
MELASSVCPFCFCFRVISENQCRSRGFALSCVLHSLTSVSSIAKCIPLSVWLKWPRFIDDDRDGGGWGALCPRWWLRSVTCTKCILIESLRAAWGIPLASERKAPSLFRNFIWGSCVCLKHTLVTIGRVTFIFVLSLLSVNKTCHASVLFHVHTKFV